VRSFRSPIIIGLEIHCIARTRPLLWKETFQREFSWSNARPHPPSLRFGAVAAGILPAVEPRLPARRESTSHGAAPVENRLCRRSCSRFPPGGRRHTLYGRQDARRYGSSVPCATYSFGSGERAGACRAKAKRRRMRASVYHFNALNFQMAVRAPSRLRRTRGCNCNGFRIRFYVTTKRVRNEMTYESSQ
jgi:hypothetical protein